jgi:hypothetical protein
MAELDASICEKIGDSIPENEVDEDLTSQFPEVPDDIFLDEREDEYDPAEPEATMPEADDYTPEAFDEYLTAEVLLPNMGSMVRAKVTGRKRDADGKPIGLRNSNPILDSRQYEVEFPDGATDIFTANTIAESMYSQVDGEGHSVLLMSEITDHKRDGTAVSKDDGFEVTPTGQRRPRRTTQGWKLLVSWKDGSTAWVPLKDLKESHPVQVAEYALVNKLLSEPAFAWWSMKVLKKRDRIIRKVKSRYWQRTHKYGIVVPKSVEEALCTDKETWTEFWTKAIEKEMKNIEPAFEFHDDDIMPVGYQHIDCHMIFDVKITLERKA